jgi:ribosomal protein L34
MHVKVRSSKSKRLKKTGFLTRQRSKGGRKVNRRQRARHGAF